MTEEGEGIWYKLANIDRNIILGLWIVGMVVMVVNPILYTPEISEMTYRAVATVEAAVADARSPDGRPNAILEQGHSPAAVVYMGYQFDSLIKLAVRSNCRIYIILGNAATAYRAELAISNAASEYGADRLVYGVDWMMFPYLTITNSFIEAFCTDTASLYLTDYYGTPIGDVPMMQYFRDYNDMDLHLLVSNDCTYGETRYRAWQGYGLYHVLSGLSSCTPMFMAYQVAAPARGATHGMLDGDHGAYQLDKIMNWRSGAASIVAAQQMVTLYLIIIMTLGSIGYNLSKKKKRVIT
jgi:hypothetical protein